MPSLPEGVGAMNGHVTNGHLSNGNSDHNLANGSSNGHANGHAPEVDPSSSSHNNPSLRITGMGVEYPPFQVGPEALETLAQRFYPDTEPLKKVLTINRYTGIDARSTIGNVDHPIVNQAAAPSIAQLNQVFVDHGIPLSISAVRSALQQAGLSPDDITHMVSTTCTNSANPGFDHYVAKSVGLRSNTQKVLLHGVGCSGGAAALRTAANLALGATYQKKPARIVVLACEISSVLVRSELDSITEDGQVRIGPCLFSDCASAVILSNGIGQKAYENLGLFELLGCQHDTIPDTDLDLGFDVHPSGWKVVLTQRVPKVTSAVVQPIFSSLLEEVATSSPDKVPSLRSAQDFDWALHPGGSTVIMGVQAAMGLTEDHLRASYDVYVNHGNSSSATIFSVLKRLLEMGEVGEGAREHVIGCAFGPGIAVEACLLKRLKSVPVNGTDILIAEDLD